ncbi:unnamed protein product [Leptidea sinapis]|uniref:Uncharacterized protein n=1 Tax=Leptidea sinapis TaxID=189913 RepID=A0A5E4PMG7_9NEOP|nr:unnamed protein product [Leptidea sinapis]
MDLEVRLDNVLEVNECKLPAAQSSLNSPKRFTLSSKKKLITIGSSSSVRNIAIAEYYTAKKEYVAAKKENILIQSEKLKLEIEKLRNLS